MDIKPDPKEIDEQIELIGAHLEMRRIEVTELLEHNITQEALNNLKDIGKITISKAGVIKFTEEGEKEFKRLIRNHRLAERLMTDVFVVSEKDTESVACEFEHFLNVSVADSICTFLGHPRTCPHGRPIPQGKCCKQKKSDLSPIIVSLNNLKSGDVGRISYIATKNHSRLDKLSSMGIMPGKTIRIHQMNPAIVIMFDETTLSMDEEIGSEIFVLHNKIK